MAISPYIQCPGGFITTRTLDNGHTLIEGWHFNTNPFDGSDPRHEVAYHWIAKTTAETIDTITEITGWLDKPLGTTRTNG